MADRDDKEKTRIQDLIFERILDSWNSDTLVECFYAEYQRGYEDARKDIMAEIAKVAGLVKRGEELQEEINPSKKQIASSIMEVSNTAPEAISKPKQDRPKPPEGRKDVGGQINPKRPEGLETNIELATMAITALGGAAAASQIQDWVRKNKWGGVPKYWNSSLYDLAAAKKLSRDGINFTLPKPAFEAISDEIVKRETVTQVEPEVLPKEQARAPLAKTAIGLPPLEIGFVKFEYRDKAVMLDKHQWRIAEALKRAKGKGFLDYTFLGTQARGTASRHGVSDRTYLQEVVPILSEKLAKIGLVVEHTPSFGYTMKEAG